MSQIKEEKAHTQAMLNPKKKRDVKNEDPRVKQTCKQWQTHERQKKQWTHMEVEHAPKAQAPPIYTQPI